MSYFIVYGTDEDKEPEEGPHLASGGGWLAWGDHALEVDDLTECHCLAANGYSDDLTALAKELDKLDDVEGDEDVKAISQTIREAIASKPSGCEAIVVTDGTEPGEEDDEDDEDDDDDDDEDDDKKEDKKDD